MHLHRKQVGLRYVIAAGWMAVAALLAVPALAAEPDPPPRDARELLAIRLQAVGRNTPEWKALMVDGRTRADFCAHCHGEAGNSVMPLVPNLGGQNPFYLLEQIEKFADGRRKDYIMSPLARQFSREDRIAVVFYYANMPAGRQAADPALVERGAVLYGQRCIACHGREAHGSDKYARLAGQHPAYLKRRLADFREVTGNAASVMSGIALTLSENETAALTAYLSVQP